MDRTIRIILIEDHPGYRDTIQVILENQEDMKLMEQFGTAEIALRALQTKAGEHLPDLILLDLNLPGMSGLEAIPWIRQYAPDTEIIILTQSDKATEVRRAIAEGASGYLLKSATLKQITEGIRTVMSGGATLDPEVARFILNELRAKPEKVPDTKALSERELEILELLSEGLAKKDIADQLDIAVTTVAYHVKHIYEKLEVANAPAAIGKAYRSGILPTEKNE